MVKIFRVPDLTGILERIGMLENRFSEYRDAGRGNLALTKEQSELVQKLLKDAMEYCQSVGFEKGLSKAASLFAFVVTMAYRYDISATATELFGLHGAIMEDVFDHQLVQVSPALRKYLDMKEPFGSDVAAKFTSATNDLREAGNCLALGCNPAVVYHLMRAAEVGLWELGRDRQIPLANSGKIEFAQWGVIIGELETAVEAIQQWPNSHTKEDAHKFYNSLLSEIRAFNDGWRRHSAHARPHQPPVQADDVLALWGHVLRFMTTLASRISERQHTELVWRTP